MILNNHAQILVYGTLQKLGNNNFVSCDWINIQRLEHTQYFPSDILVQIIFERIHLEDYQAKLSL